MTILWKRGDYAFCQDYYTKSYAIFRKVRYVGKSSNHYQQITYWYVRRKWCEKALDKIMRGEL